MKDNLLFAVFVFCVFVLSESIKTGHRRKVCHVKRLQIKGGMGQLIVISGLGLAVCLLLAKRLVFKFTSI